MIIISKFAGVCKKCNGRLAAGVAIDWVKGVGASHVTAAECEAAKVYGTPDRGDEQLRKEHTAVTLDGSKIAAFLVAARDRGPLKFPKVAFLGPNDTELVISLAGPGSKNPGAVFVKLSGNYLGSIAADGTVRGELKANTEILSILDAVAVDPVTAAVAYGKLRGNCSFCRKLLTDDRTGSSVEVGYGPKCAKNYGLPHAPKGARKVLKAIPEAA